MKKLFKKTNLVLLSALAATSVFAANPTSSTELTFDLSNADAVDTQNPYFYCDVTDNSGALDLVGTRVDLKVLKNTLKFEGNVEDYSNLSVSDMQKNYFKVTKGDSQGDGTVRVTVDKGSQVVCNKGKGNRTTEYQK